MRQNFAALLIATETPEKRHLKRSMDEPSPSRPPKRSGNDLPTKNLHSFMQKTSLTVFAGNFIATRAAWKFSRETSNESLINFPNYPSEHVASMSILSSTAKSSPLRTGAG